jgi:membrane-bound lytic murein transglycosylase MltF
MYSDKYDVDWLLMAAQGYQESQLNQAARSPVGAIGVMQVMPQTGTELKVGDITEAEANIHAGVKYMRWMIDHYYENDPMTKLDKALFAFAAKRGLDANVWFHNVEYVAAEKIGAETVTYVSNIYKYSIAYKLIMEAKAEREKAAEKIKGQSK